MVKRLALVVLLFCCTEGVATAQGSDWIKVAPVGGGFSVLMPAKPEEEVRPGDDLTTHLFRVTTDSALYLVAYGDYAASTSLKIDDELVSNRDRFLKDLNATLKTTQQLTVDGRKGIEFTGQSDQAFFKSRVFIFGIRFYQIAIAVFQGNDDTENANRFFASFEFTKAGARTRS